MQRLNINQGTGEFLHYEDSGAPLSSTKYSTIILIHGLIWHSPIFRRLFEHAPNHNLRLITFNAPGYPGSSAIPNIQAKKFASPDPEDQANAIFEVSATIARGVARLIEQEHFPMPSEKEGVRTGGLRILGWSCGNIFLVSWLAGLRSFESSVSAILERYITSFIIYDAPSLVFGTPKPSETYSPIEDTSLQPSEAIDLFNKFVSGFFEPFQDLSSVSSAALVQRRSLADVSEDTKYTPVSSRMADDVLADVTYPATMICNPMPFSDPITLEVHRPNCHRAFFDTKGYWKDVDVLVLWADMSFLHCPWGAKYLQGLLDRPIREEEQRRNIRIMKIENTNHFLHWEDPQRCVQIIANCSGTLGG